MLTLLYIHTNNAVTLYPVYVRKPPIKATSLFQFHIQLIITRCVTTLLPSPTDSYIKSHMSLKWKLCLPCMQFTLYAMYNWQGMLLSWISLQALT